jgi:hypothetical protein
MALLSRTYTYFARGEKHITVLQEDQEYYVGMKTTHETDENRDWQCIPLAEVEAAGVGAVYEVAGMNIEPVAVYIGEGLFKGVHIEERGNVFSLRLSIEEHHDLHPGKTALPLQRVGHVSPEKMQDNSALMKYLIDEVCVFYACAAEQGLPSAYALDQSGVATKLQIFASVQSKLFRGELAVSEAGVIDLNK